MNTTTRRIRNPYKTKKGFIADPFASLYQAPDEDVLQPESVEDLIHYAWSLEESLAGDFDLKTVITEIKSQVLSFVRTGLLAYKVKVFKLYRNVHKNFRVFCEKALGVSHWQINRTIEAARVVLELAQAGFSVLPTCEAQARPLNKLHGAELYAKWKMVVNSLEPHTITSNRINEVLGVETKAKSLRLPKELYEQLKNRALELGLSIEEFLHLVLNEDNGVGLVDEDALANWEQDLETLASQAPEDIQEDVEEDLQDEKSVPIGQTSYNVSSPSPQKTSTNTPTNKGTASEYVESAPSPHKDISIPRNTKPKRKKPLFEAYSLEKQHKSRNKQTKPGFSAHNHGNVHNSDTHNHDGS